MIFSEQDMDLLRLLRWCRYLSPDDLHKLFPEDIAANLQALRLIRRHQTKNWLMLTAKGNAFLSEHLSALPPDTQLPYQATAMVRRLRTSKLMLTAYRAGLPVFTTKMNELLDQSAFFMPTMTRGRGSNPWGSTRIGAVIHLGDLLCSAHYVCPNIGKLSLTDELALFTNNTAGFRNVCRCFLFAGDSYQSILSELQEYDDCDTRKLIRYGDAYRYTSYPCYLLPCNDTGARQLQVMSVPGYRKKLAQLSLRQCYAPPPKGNAVWDAMFQGQPLIISVDMDLRRLDAAIQEVHHCGYDTLSIVIFGEQTSVVLQTFQNERDILRTFRLKEETLAELFGQPRPLYTPSPTQYLTEKGAVIRAPLIQAD